MAEINKAVTPVPTVKRKKPVNKRRVAFILCCCVPPVIMWLIFYVGVNLTAFTMAFTNKDGVVSFENFKRFWDEISNPTSDLRIAFVNTFLTFAINMIAFPFKVLVSYFLYKKVPGSAVFRILFFIPSYIFGVALVMIVQQLIGVNGFVAQGLQELLNLDYTPTLLADSRYANITVLVHMLWMGFPGDLIIWGGTFARIPVDVLESGRIDGVNWWQEFTKITVPLVWPTVALNLVLSFCGIFAASGAVFLLTRGDYGTMTIPAWLYIQLVDMSGNQYTSNVYNYLSAVGLVLTVISIAISLVIRRWTDRAFDDVDF